MTLAFETVAAGRLRDLDPGAGDIWWQILGPVAATRQGAALDLGAPRQRAVLTLLLSRAGDTVPLSRIVEAVWGQDPPRYAVNTVHKHVGALRRVAEPGLPRRAQGRWLRSDARGYRVTADERTLDLLRFRALAARGRPESRYRHEPAAAARPDRRRRPRCAA